MFLRLTDILTVFLLIALLHGCQPNIPYPDVDRYPVQIGKRYGYINTRGEVVIPAKFYSVEWFHNNRAIVETEAGKKAIIDKSGNTVFQDSSGYLRKFFDSGLTRFDKKDGTACFIDTLGIERFCLSDSIADSGASFRDGRLRVRFPGRRFAFLDTDGKVVFELERGFPGSFSGGLVPVYFEGRTCYVDSTGRRKFCVKGRGQSFNFASDLAMVVDEGKTYFINRRGKRKIDKLDYDTVASFINGFAKVEKGNRKGFIDRKGREVIPPVYEDAVFCSSGLFAVKPPGEDWIFVDKNNTQVIEQSFWRITMPGFVGELAYVYIGEKQGYINKQGKFVWTFDGNKMDSQLSIE